MCAATVPASRQALEMELQQILTQYDSLGEELAGLLKQDDISSNAFGNGTSVNSSASNIVANSNISQPLDNLREAQPDFRLLRTSGALLSSQILEAHNMAERVSSAVRRLDRQRARAQATLAVVEEAVELRGCAEGVKHGLEKRDLANSVHHVRRFQQLDAGALKGSKELTEMQEAMDALASAVLEEFNSAIEYKKAADVAFYRPLLGPLGLSERTADVYIAFARNLLEQRFEQAGCDNPDPPQKLLPSLYNATAAFLQDQLSSPVHGVSSGNSDSTALLKMAHSECGGRAAAILLRHLAAEKVSERIAQFPALFDESKPGGITELSPQQLTEMDSTLDTIALLLQHTESYTRYVNHLAEGLEAPTHQRKFSGVEHTKHPKDVTSSLPGRTSLDEVAGEVSALYSEFEQQLLHASLNKALSINEPLEGSTTSSCVEDIFFVAQRCARRALATGNCGAASAVINHVAHMLSGELIVTLSSAVSACLHTLPSISGMQLGATGAALDTTLRNLGQLDFTQLQGNLQGMGQGIASDLTNLSTSALSSIPFKSKPDQNTNQGAGSHAHNQGGGGGMGGQYEGQKLRVSECIIWLNNIEACGACMMRLKADLEKEANEIYQTDKASQLVMASLSELTNGAEAFSQALSSGLEEVMSRLRPVIRAVVAAKVGEKSQVSYRLTEVQYAMSGDPWAHELSEGLDGLLRPYQPPEGLSNEGFSRLLSLIADSVSRRIEAAIRQKRFSQLGALQLDKDLRTLMNTFARLGGAGVRAAFARLQQIALLLALDDPSDSSELWVTGSALKQQLAADEVKAILALRHDFTPHDVEKVEL